MVRRKLRRLENRTMDIVPKYHMPRLVLEQFSPRERDVIVGLMARKRAKEIAAELGIAECTVRNHLRRIYCTVDVHSAGALILLLEDQANTR